ncbi:MAG TPA: DUF4214 domain-containing protein, partial [Pirellulales bacterium]|nr:DUF4214 domain-containing protein [Pirellulales bacterium]
TDSNPGLFTATGQPAVDGSGTLTYTLNADVSGSATITMYLTDSGGTANGGIDTSVTQSFTINVNFVNDAPSFTLPSTNISINEDSGVQSLAGFATKISPSQNYPPEANEANQTVAFHVSADNTGLFAVQPAIDAAGALTYTLNPDVSGTANVSVYLTDNGGTANGGLDTSPTQTFTLNVNFVNDPPSFTLPTTPVSVLEDSGVQSVATFATNISPSQNVPPETNEATQTVHFNVVDDTNSPLFAVAPSIDPSGTLSYTLNPNVSGTAIITVDLQDNGGTANGGQDTSATQTFTIDVNFVNDPPSFTIPNPTVTVNENAGTQLLTPFAANISASQQLPPEANEAGQKVHFNVTANSNAGLFTADGQPAIDSVGELTYTLAPDVSGTALITVDLQDNGGTANGGEDTSPTQQFTINVAYVNDPPSFTIAGNPPAVNEDTGPQTVANFATKISPSQQYPPETNEQQQAVHFNVTGDTSSSLFTATGQPAIDANGTLTYTLAPNVSGSAVIAVDAQDDGKEPDGSTGPTATSATQSFTIVANFVNDAPSFTLAGGPPAANENTGAQTVANFATNISPSQQYPAEANEAGQSVHFNVTADTNASLFAVPPSINAAGTLSYTLAQNVFGTAAITVDLQDSGGTANGGQDTSATQTFNIVANFVPAPPVFTHLGPDQLVSEDSAAQTQTVTGWAAASPGVDGDQSNETISYAVSTAVTSVTPTGQPLFSVDPAISSSGTLTFTPGTNVFGTATVTVIAEETGGALKALVVDSQPITFHITVDQVLHAPEPVQGQVLLPATVTVNENAADKIFSDLSKVFDDLDTDQGLNDPIVLSVTNTNPGLLTATLSGTDPATAGLTFHFLDDQFGTATIDLIATDQAGTATDQMAVVVNQINQAPSFAVGTDQRVAMNSSPLPVPGWATQIADGPANQSGETLSFVVSPGATTNPSLFPTLPTIVPDKDASGNYTGTGTLSFAPAAGQSGKATFFVTLHNSGGTANGGSDTSTTQTFTIEVAGIPTAVDHSYVLSVGGTSSATAGDGVLVGDGDPNGDPIAAQLVAPPANGSVSLNPDGSFTYTKGAAFEGTDSFSYRVSNGLLAGGVATVNITSYEATIVTKLYNQVLNRAPDAGGLNYWTNLIQQGQSYGIIAEGIFLSDEHLDPIIETYYQQFLLRPADAAGLAYWGGIWKAAGGPEPVIAGMITSPEFFREAAAAHPDLSTNAAWITALYERLLKREPDSAGLQFWVGQLDSGAMTPTQVVNGFEYSAENFQNLVTGFFNEYLGRGPSSSELTSYVSQFEQGATEAQIQIEIIDTPEYANTPPPPASGSVRQLS